MYSVFLVLSSLVPPQVSFSCNREEKRDAWQKSSCGNVPFEYDRYSCDDKCLVYICICSSGSWRFISLGYFINLRTVQLLILRLIIWCNVLLTSAQIRLKTRIFITKISVYSYSCKWRREEKHFSSKFQRIKH